MPKTLLATITACVAALALASGEALANTLSVDDQDFKIVWSPFQFSAVGMSTIECDLTLSGSFHSSTMAKGEGALVGHITGASVEQPSCEGGSATVLTGTLPWHVQYSTFNGPLPNITGLGIQVIGWRWSIATEIATCLSTTTEGEPARFTANVGGGGAISSLTSEEGDNIDTNDTSGIFCDFAGVNYSQSGTGVLEDTSANALVLRLGDIPPPPTANLTPAPNAIDVEENEASDRFTLTNDGTGATATIDRTVLEGVSTESPEISVSAPGCEARIIDGASCVFTVAGTDQPLTEASVVIHYDNGAGGNRTVEVGVEVRRDSDPGLTADAPAVTIEPLEQNDTFIVRNEGDTAATISRVGITAADAITPEFEAASPGCRSTLNPGEACSYTVTVNARPEEDGRITIYYRDEGGERTLVVDVDIVAPRPPVLEADPNPVAVERLEANDSFVLRNVGEGTAAALISRIDTVVADTERPEFSVTGPGCPMLLIDEASCTYIISVNARPEPSGRVVFYYEDGITGARSTTVEIDIAS